MRLLAALLGLLLTGCLTVEERLAFEREGNGTYSLKVRWNADLLARVRDVAGPKALAACEGAGFPLSAAALREGLAPLPGVKVEQVEEADDGAGWRRLELRVAFATLEDLLRWEVLAGRPLAIGPTDGEREGRLTMRPIERLPLLDPLREAFEARRAPPPQGPASEAQKDPPPWERLGLSPSAVVLLERLLPPALEQVRLEFEVAPAGRVLVAGPQASVQEARRARFAWRYADLEAGRPREVALTFQAGEFDKIPVAQQPASAPAAPAGTR